MTKPRILVLTHFFPSHRGGVEMTAGRIATRLAKRGYRITWMASDTDPAPDPCANMEFLPMQAFNGFEKRLGLPYPLWSRQSLAKVAEAVKGADILHIHESLYHGNVFGARTAKRLGIPYLVTQHVGFIPYKNPLLRAVLTIANRRIALPTLTGATAVAFMSEITQNYFKALGFQHRDAELIPLGVDTEIFRPTGKASKTAFGFAEDRPLCLYVGRFVEKKGLPIIRMLAEADPNVQWALAGWGAINPDSWGLPNVKVVKDVNGPTLAPLYRAADLCVMPSIGEGYPAVIQESMACGTPVLVSSETAEGYSPARAHLTMVPASNLDEWKQTTMKLLSDTTSLGAESSSLVAFAGSHWAWSTCVDRYEAMIVRALEAKAA